MEKEWGDMKTKETRRASITTQEVLAMAATLTDFYGKARKQIRKTD